MIFTKLFWRLIFPLSIISLGLFTKWWYVLPVHAPDTMMYGFPLAFLSEGWHTSMSLQIFVLEFIFDFLVYLLFWLMVIGLIQHYKALNISKYVTRILWILATLIIAFNFWVSSLPVQRFYLKRNWGMQVLVSGYYPTWSHLERPDIYKYHPKKK